MMERAPDKLGPFDLEEVYELIDWADSLGTESDPGSGMNAVGDPIRLRIGDRFMKAGHKSVSLLEASEGALYVLFMLALAGHEKGPKIFAVDNFDQALHPRLACALTRLVLRSYPGGRLSADAGDDAQSARAGWIRLAG